MYGLRILLLMCDVVSIHRRGKAIQTSGFADRAPELHTGVDQGKWLFDFTGGMLITIRYVSSIR
jgi:hypothetical protein